MHNCLVGDGTVSCPGRYGLIAPISPSLLLMKQWLCDSPRVLTHIAFTVKVLGLSFDLVHLSDSPSLVGLEETFFRVFARTNKVLDPIRKGIKPK